MLKHAIDNSVSIIKSIFGLNMKTDVLLYSTFGGFTIGSISGIVNDWIYEPSSAFYALMLLIMFDYATGIWLAWKRNRFETRKAIRIFWTLCSHVALLSFATNLSKGSDVLYWMNEGIFVPLVLVNMISLVKNLSLLGWIKKDISKILYEKIDAYKNEMVDNVDSDNNGRMHNGKKMQ